MKKSRFLVLFIISLLLVSCASNQSKYDDRYESGYEEGYSQGYYDGIAEAKRQLEDIVVDDFNDICNDIEDEWGISPEDAAQLLSNYADVPDEVDERDVPNAIWAIYSYFHDSWDVIFDIDSHDID